MRCSSCKGEVDTCFKCNYIFERLSDVVKCLTLKDDICVHFCNDDCLIDFVFEHKVVDAYTTE
jgi:hypothetical protein